MKPRFLSVVLEESRSLRELAVLSLAFKRLWNKASKVGVVLAVIFSALEAALYAVNPFILRHLIDVLNKGYNFGWQQPLPHRIALIPATNCASAAMWLTAALIACSVLWYGAYNTSTGFARNATYYSQVTFGTECFAHILNLSMDFHVESRKGEVLAKTDQAVREAQDFLYNSFFGNFLRAGLSIVLILGVIYAIDWRLFAICFATLGLGLYTNFMFGSRVSKEEKVAWRNVSEVTARSLDVMQNIRETKIFGNEGFEAERRQRDAEQQLVPLRRITMLWRELTTIENLWQNFGFALAMFLIILPKIFSRGLTVGQVAQFIGYYLMLFGYFNIGYSRVGASADRIVAAARVAQAHRFIQELPQGYDTVVSERAANISGGQKQRIALARAVLARDAEVVILDEPTTGLDTMTAREFLDELIHVFSGKTIVVITHDPTVMRRADRVVFMENGRVERIGSHDELVQACEGYRNLVLAA